MAHYAFLDEDSVVTEVINGKDETELLDGLDPETWYSNFRGQRCVRTSYNAASNGFRKNFAGIGYTYDDALDAFIRPRPFPSWILDESTCQWDAPIPYPTDEKFYTWNEDATSWDEVAPLQ